MERTTGNEVGTRFFERQISLDHVHDIKAIEQVLNETFWNHSALAVKYYKKLFAAESTEKSKRL